MPDLKFKPTDAQTRELGFIVADHIGCNVQTGISGLFPESVYVSWQATPNGRVHFAHIQPDGEVTFG